MHTESGDGREGEMSDCGVMGRGWIGCVKEKVVDGIEETMGGTAE